MTKYTHCLLLVGLVLLCLASAAVSLGYEQWSVRVVWICVFAWQRCSPGQLVGCAILGLFPFLTVLVLNALLRGYPNHSLSLPRPCPSPGSLRGLDQQDLHCRVPRIRPSASRVVDTLGDGVGLGRLRLPAWLQGIADGELSGTNIGDEGTRRWSLPNPASMCHGEGGVVRSALTAYIMPASPHLLQLPPRHPFYVLILSCCGRLTRRWDFAHRHQHHTTSHKAHPP